MQPNTVTNITAKESLKKTKFKWLGGCFSVDVSSKLLGNEVFSSCFGHADLRSDCSKSWFGTQVLFLKAVYALKLDLRADF